MLTDAGIRRIFPIRNMKTIGNSVELGAVIRAERKRLKVTQKEVALAAGIGLRFLIELERGKPTSRIEGVFKALQVLGIHLAVGANEGHKTVPSTPQGAATP